MSSTEVKMPDKVKRLSVFSFLLIAVLTVLVAYQLFKQATDTTNVESSILRAEIGDSLIVRFAFTNNEERELNYTYYFYIDNELSLSRTVLMDPNNKFTLGSNINTTKTPVTTVRFVIYKSGDPEPIYDVVHHVD